MNEAREHATIKREQALAPRVEDQDGTQPGGDGARQRQQQPEAAGAASALALSASRQAVLAALAARLVTAADSKAGPLIVGLSGAYASGKTRLATDLATVLRRLGHRVVVLHYDDFHRPLQTLTWDAQEPGSEVDTFYAHAFDGERLCELVLAPLAAAGSLHADLRVLDWAQGANVKALRLDIEPDTIVLLEGMLLFRPPVVGYLDLRIFLTVEEGTILARGRLRDAPLYGPGIMALYERRYLPVYRRYLAADRPERGAIVIANDDPDAPVMQADD
ncbi:nucleoside/nucleotide kinase family protein [Lacticaseibacillus suihuaensis]